MIEVKLDTSEIEVALQQAMEKTGDLEPVLQDIGEYLVDSTRQRFHDKEAPDGTPWADNSPLTQALKGSNDPLVGESQSLGRYFHYNISGGNTLEFGSNLEYAAVQHFGIHQGAFGRSQRNTPLPWGDIPARPFLGVSSEDQDAILGILRDFLSSAE